MVDIPKKKSLPVDIDAANPESHQEYIRTVDDDLTLLFDREVINQETIEGLQSDLGDLTSDLSDLGTEVDGKEDSLGNPSVDDYVLASTTAGARSWVPPLFTNMAVITATGTWTRPAGVKYVFVEMWGGGGGGAGGGTSSNGGSGGGGGYGCGILAISSNLSVTIGAAGNNGNGGGSPTNGTAGGATSVTGTGVPANFSVGGGGAGTTTAAGGGGSPGAGVTFGIVGGVGEIFPSAINKSALGGEAGRGGTRGLGTARIPGGGGGGGNYGTSGAAGAVGRVVIWY